MKISFSITPLNSKLERGRTALKEELWKLERSAKVLPPIDRIVKPDKQIFLDLKRIKSGQKNWADFFKQGKQSPAKVANAYSIYWNTTGNEAKSLPDIDESLIQIFTREIESKNLGQLKKLTQFYFNCFSAPAVQTKLGNYLHYAWNKRTGDLYGMASKWKANCEALFDSAALHKSIGKLQVNESFSNLVERLGIPETSRFHEELSLQHFLRRIEESNPEQEDEQLWQEIIDSKNEVVGGRKFGALVAQTMVERVELVFDSKWPAIWRELLIPVSSNPYDNSPIWWSWASSQQLKTARAAIIIQKLKSFLEVVRDTHRGNPHQWESREKFLLKLLENDQIQSIWIMLNPAEIEKLNKRQIETIRPVRIVSKISFIYLQCTDKIDIVEGSEDCFIRAWARESSPFRVYFKNTDEKPIRDLVDHDFRKPQNIEVEQKHIGDWSFYFLSRVQNHLGVRLMDPYACIR